MKPKEKEVKQENTMKSLLDFFNSKKEELMRVTEHLKVAEYAEAKQNVSFGEESEESSDEELDQAEQLKLAE